jgi:phenylpropionate dioxygenase-like ring-hydroxylating dioxygenase large terminal subunit
MNLTKPSDPNLAPGAARCPGPSTREIIVSDGDQVPGALLEEQYEFLGDEDIPFGRYTSPAMFDAEVDKVWSKTWQWACREEHIPEVGDYVVYDVAHYSLIVVRTAPEVVKAYYNSCPHRGMQFFEPGSRGTRKQFFRCPFHGMSWHLDGALKEIPCRWDFPHVQDDDFQLPEARIALWGGFVFVNLDPDAVALDEYLEVLPEHFAQWPFQDRYVAVHTKKKLPANWKMAMEAFLEAFHVLATHPEAIRTAGDANAQYDIFGDNVTRFVHTIGYPSPHLDNPPTDRELLALVTGVEGAIDIPEGESARTLYAAHMRDSLGEEYGVDLSAASTSQMLDSIEYFLFPNMFLFPGINIPMIYRFRPIDVDTCWHEILYLKPVPDSGERPPPAECTTLEIEESYTTAPGFPVGLGYVLDQDTVNLERQRNGAKTAFKSGQTLGNYQEARIRRLHMTLDKYLQA